MTAAAVVIAALGASLVGYAQTNRQVNRDVDRFLTDRTEEILDGLRERPGRPDDDDDRQRRNNSATDNDAEVQTISDTGEILASIGVVLPIDERDLRLAEREGPQLLRTVEIDSTMYRMATTHVNGGGALQVARSLKSTNSLLASIRNQVVVIGLLVAAVAGFLGWLFARHAMRPLSTLATSVERVAETQDLSTRVGNDSHDEVGRLSRGFDDMMSALSTSRDQQHRLVQDAAHELRTPLTSVSANIELLAHAKDLDADTRNEMIAGVRSELRQLNTLFTEIVELATDSHDRALDREVDLRRLAEDVAGQQRARTSNPITIEGASSKVLGDPPGLQRAIANLVSNAVKYSPESAPVVVRVGERTISVTDEGAGIPESEHERIFERFYRSDAARSQPGSGLGLAIVKKIVTDHGGTTFVESSPNTGATVGFRLPAPTGIAHADTSSPTVG